ncbi:MAG: Hsp33 family molecular chaperone HslO [Candidatus Sphingomonas colombiensis]|nr:Hsp33 family molecular chaperone HslO [Sphingomonas sp.]WEK41774.1 MAG: Hsp33 family molecular chaperone HslO [Sphingomonas sp.]
MTDTTKTDLDRALGFTIPARDARGRVTRLGPVVDAILSGHAYPPPIENLLAEALVLGALIGSTLKDAAGQLTLQAQTENGVVRLLVVDYRGGELRGYVDFDPDRLAACAGRADLVRACSGRAISRSPSIMATHRRALSGRSSRSTARRWPQAAEQLFRPARSRSPASSRVGVAVASAAASVAGGLLLQHLPEGEDRGASGLHVRLDHPEWEHVAALGSTMGVGRTRRSRALPLENLVWRLFNEESPRCGCSRRPRDRARLPLQSADHIRSVIARFPLDQSSVEMADESGRDRCRLPLLLEAFSLLRIDSKAA